MQIRLSSLLADRQATPGSAELLLRCFYAINPVQCRLSLKADLKAAPGCTGLKLLLAEVYTPEAQANTFNR